MIFGRKSLTEVGFWGAIIPAVLATGIVVMALSIAYLANLYSAPDFSEVLAGYQSSIFVKPTALLHYVLALFFLPLFILFFGSYFSANEPSPVLVVSAKSLLVVWIVFNFFYQEFYSHPYFVSRWIPILLFSPPIYFFILKWLQNKSEVSEQLNSKLTLKVNAGLFILGVIALLPCLYNEGNFKSASVHVIWHLPYTFDEFSAVLNGKTPLVDFFPLYSNFLPYAFIPFFKVFGLSIASFTTAMAMLSGFVLYSGFTILRRLTPGIWTTALLFLAWLTVIIRPLEGTGLDRYSNFSYYAAGPLRYFGFWTVAALTLAAAARFKKYPDDWTRPLLCIAWAWLSAFNNLDMGLPALVASIVVLALSSRKPSWILRMAFFAGLPALLIWLALPYFRTGQLPSLIEWFRFVFAAGKYGFAGYPTPEFGMHWIVVSGLIVSLVIGLRSFILNDEDPLMAPLLYFGIAGGGAFAYFINRSHWQVLLVYSVIGIFPFFLLSLKALYSREWVLRNKISLPLAAISFLFACCFSLINFLPDPVGNLERMVNQDDRFTTEQAQRVQFIQENTNPGEQTFVSYPFGHWLAFQAGKVNVYPYTVSESIVLKSQLALTIHAIETHHIKSIFGRLPFELEIWANGNGFSKKAALGDFSVWKRVDLNLKP